MIRFALRTVFSALIFTFIINMINGAHFSGAFWPDGIVYGLLLAVVVWVLDMAMNLFIVVTLGFGVFVRIFCFWLIPAIQLKVLAHYFPHHLSFDGWMSAIFCGLIFMVVNALTSSSTKTSSSSDD
jgi:uncharacterized membrane protein YvlD (DUF360 family)